MKLYFTLHNEENFFPTNIEITFRLLTTKTMMISIKSKVYLTTDYEKSIEPVIKIYENEIYKFDEKLLSSIIMKELIGCLYTQKIIIFDNIRISQLLINENPVQQILIGKEKEDHYEISDEDLMYLKLMK